jgi:PHP family Zn ribbon phosphoesterase
MLFVEINTDLHAHSAFAGGALGGGKSQADKEKRIKKRFIESSLYSPLKGVDLIGTGDCQFEPWLEFLTDNLIETEPGIYSYESDFSDKNEIVPQNKAYQDPKYLLQTEIIFTGPVPNSKKRKKAHVLLYFPDITRIKEFNELLDQFNVARANMARPFIVSSTLEETELKLNSILDLDPMIEAIPAHVLTPEGVYGSNQRINRLEDFFGSAEGRINAIETGLSADPNILGLIPELDNRTLVSNADAHSSSLNRIGREFTTLSINKLDYRSIITSIRENKVLKTAEFHPTEGRYFLTGHRSGRKQPKGHETQSCCFSPKYVPANDLCPQCGKELTVGVLQRAYEICKEQDEMRRIGDGPNRPFVTMVPLIEIIAFSLGMKSLNSKKIVKLYSEIIKITKTEVNLWTSSTKFKELWDSNVPNVIIENILKIKSGNFSFSPVGFDGIYGVLKIGKTEDYEEISIVQ